MISNNETYSVTDNVTDSLTDNDSNFYDLIIYMCSQNLLKMFCFYMLHCEYHFSNTYPYNDYVVENIYTDLKKMYRNNNPKLMFFNDMHKLRKELTIILSHMEYFMDDKKITYDKLKI